MLEPPCKVSVLSVSYVSHSQQKMHLFPAFFRVICKPMSVLSGRRRKDRKHMSTRLKENKGWTACVAVSFSFLRRGGSKVK